MRLPCILIGLTVILGQLPVHGQEPGAPVRSLSGPGGLTVEVSAEAVVLKQGEFRLPVSLVCPRFTIDGAEVGGKGPPVGKAGRMESGQVLELPCVPIVLGDSSRLEVKLCLKWSADEGVLRKWAVYRMEGASDAKLLSEVVLEDLDTNAGGLRVLAEQPVNDDGIQSRPVFLAGFFAGIEYPVACGRVENGRMILSHRPGLRMQPGTWYETRKAVYGITAVGAEKKTFKRYIEAHRPLPKGSHHFLYNPYWSTPTTPSQEQILGIMRTIGEKLYKPYGVTFDSYGLTVFTTDPKSIWEVDKKRFPRGLVDLQKACSDVGSHLDIFLSPNSVYPPALDPKWAKEQGYETFKQGPGMALCLAGKRYQSQTKKAIVDLVSRYDANHRLRRRVSVRVPGERPWARAGGSVPRSHRRRDHRHLRRPARGVAGRVACPPRALRGMPAHGGAFT